MIETDRKSADVGTTLDGDTTGNSAGNWSPAGVTNAAWGFVCVLAFFVGSMILAAGAVAVFVSNQW